MCPAVEEPVLRERLLLSARVTPPTTLIAPPWMVSGPAVVVPLTGGACSRLALMPLEPAMVRPPPILTPPLTARLGTVRPPALFTPICAVWPLALTVSGAVPLLGEP